MPWKVQKGDDSCPFEVVRADTGEHVACHPTEGEAMNHVQALYANVPEGERADAPAKPYGAVTYADPGYLDGQGNQASKSGNTPQKRYPIDTADHCRAAWAYINRPDNAGQYSAEQLAHIKAAIQSAAKKFGVEIGDQQQRFLVAPPEPIWVRSAAVGDVNHSDRIITTIVVPYDQPATIAGGFGYGRTGELWEETVCRGAFDGVESAPHRVRANRDHDKTKPVGKAVQFWPNHPEGLVGEIRCAKTPLGDETLELADEGVLSASMGFGVRPGGMDLNRLTRTCRIRSAYLDHLAFVMNPAYQGAEVLSVREARALAAEPVARAATPHIDQFIGDPIFAWANQRLSR